MKNRGWRAFCRLVCFVLITGVSAHAQNVILKDGRTVEGINLRRSGATIMTAVKAGTGQGELGIPANTIARIEFQEPPQIAAVANLLAQGKVAEGLPLIEQVMAQQAPFKDIPGNRWAQAAILKITLLMSLGREREAEPVINDLIRYEADPEAVLIAKLKQAEILSKKDPAKALPVFTGLLQETIRPEILAELWLNIGNARLAGQEYQPALLAYLHLPVFFPQQTLLVPAALLGSSRAYVGLDDLPRAKRALDELLRDYPNAPQAASARTELPQIERKLKARESAKPAGEPSAN